MKVPYRHAAIFCLWLSLLLTAGCAQTAESCPTPVQVDNSQAEQYAQDQALPFRFPLDAPWKNFVTDAADFAVYGTTTRGPEYHAAEDLHKPAGTPVYAMADGQISYSGPMGGYGWLIIIDHPQVNLYSLYGHLSPSRWRLESGQVNKGELIAYLGESDENGGSQENPMRPHLHFGVRAGQRSDYPARGEWRWMAGWIKPCPQDLGWLQPSLVINNQEIPAGGFQTTSGNFLEMWSVELIMGAIYLVGAICMFIFGTKADKPYLLLLSGSVLLAAGIYFYVTGWKMSYVMFGSALLLIVTGFVVLSRRFTDSKT